MSFLKSGSTFNLHDALNSSTASHPNVSFSVHHAIIMQREKTTLNSHKKLSDCQSKDHLFSSKKDRKVAKHRHMFDVDFIDFPLYLEIFIFYIISLLTYLFIHKRTRIQREQKKLGRTEKKNERNGRLSSRIIQ